ncbi:MAG: pyruvate dehydrogenase (acetyl-transferring) E1 component subunit alpha [Spirochaetales bacterium]|nr:pyruvate dehydrogenase (acetyl-transferring) E1 component subunit alpha [Spirochaetales bacterium]
MNTLKPDILWSLRREMVRIRKFEEKAGQMYGLRKIGGFCHLYNGQEAVAVGCIGAMDRTIDKVLTGYRDHGHALAAGLDPNSIMAELFGKITGVSRGKGGSMHLFDPAQGFLGGNGIVGAQIPVATGVAFAQKYKKTGGATAVFFGDGAIHQGAFHEALNLAKIWSLPAVFICENNQWGMGTNWKRVSAVDDFSLMASAYGVRGERVDGMDVLAVRDAAIRALTDARAGNPVLLEARTYRYKGHSMSDPQKYRTRDEVDEYRKQDPIYLLEQRMLAMGAWDESKAAVQDAEADEMVEAAVAFAEASPEPAAHTIYEDVYAGEPFFAGGLAHRKGALAWQ